MKGILKLVGCGLGLLVGSVLAAKCTDVLVDNIQVPSFGKKNSDDNVEPIEVVPELVEEA